MAEWASKLNDFLKLNDRDILADAGKVSHDLAEQLALEQFQKFDAQRRAFESQNPVSDFDKTVKQLESKKKGRRSRDDMDRADAGDKA